MRKKISIPVDEVVGDSEECAHVFRTSGEEKASLEWLMRVLGMMEEGCGQNKKPATIARALIHRLVRHDFENHVKIHQLEAFIDNAFFTSPGGAKLEIPSDELN